MTSGGPRARDAAGRFPQLDSTEQAGLSARVSDLGCSSYEASIVYAFRFGGVAIVKFSVVFVKGRCGCYSRERR